MAVTFSHVLSSAFLAHLGGETSTQVRVALVRVSVSSTGFCCLLDYGILDCSPWNHCRIISSS